MKNLKNIGKVLDKTQQKNIKGGLRVSKKMERIDDCQFPPLAPPPPGCDWKLSMTTCTVTLVCTDVLTFEM